MAAIFVDCLSYGLITPMIVAVFASDVFLVGQPDWLIDVVRSLAFALFPLGMFIGAATLGDLSDRWGRKKTLLLCMGGLAIAFSCMALSIALQSTILLLLSRLVSGLLSGSIAIGQAAIIDLSNENTKAINLGRITIANAMGHFLGPAIGALLADQHLYLPFATIAGFAVLTLVWITIGMDETRTAMSTKKMDWTRPVNIFREAFSHPAVRKLLPAYILFQMGNSMTYQFLYIYLAETKGYSPGELSLYSTFAIGTGALFCTFYLLTRMQKHYCSNTLSAVPLIISGLITSLFTLNIPTPWIWIAGFIWAVAIVTAYVSTLKLFSDCVSDDMQGWAMGIGGSFFAFSFTLGGLTASLLSWLSIEFMLGLSGVILILSGLLFQLMSLKSAESP